LIEVSKQKSEEFLQKTEKIYSKLIEEGKHQEASYFNFTRKQTLKSAERYVSDYLKELEQKALDAVYQLQEKEKEILDQRKHTLSKLNDQMEDLAHNVAKLDIFVNV
jgi:DNA mismatch repair protein MutS